MAAIISESMKGNHTISKYDFKVLATGANLIDNDDFESVLLEGSVPAFTKDEHPERREGDIDSSALSSSSKDSLIESLMKKTDEMSSNFIKLQMKLETMEDQHKREIVDVKDESFAEGLEAGKKEAKEGDELDMVNGLKQFADSVATLEHSAKEFDIALEGIKKELISAALDISKEVIGIELKEHSSEVAKTLSNELIKELQSASKVKLKVNPKDHGVISESVGSMKHVEVVSDSAVSIGGVIAISDAGNIDSEISKRFERVKRAALSE